MKSRSANSNFSGRVCTLCALALACLSASGVLAAQSAAQSTPRATAKAVTPATNSSVGPSSSVGPRMFNTPQQAADALVNAAEKFDVVTLMQIFGPDGDDIVFSGEFAQDRKHAADFSAEARKKKSVSVDPKSGRRAFLLVGDEDWPFPVPLVQQGERWFFDSKAGRQELLYRRIGANELDAIDICHGYVEAQQEYAVRQRAINDVNQYAQRIVSTSRQAGRIGLAKLGWHVGWSDRRKHCPSD